MRLETMEEVNSEDDDIASKVWVIAWGKFS